MAERKYNKEHWHWKSDGIGLSKTETLKRLKAEYGDKYEVGHIGDFIDECRTNGTFEEDSDYKKSSRISEKSDADTSIYWYRYNSIKPRLVEAIKARGVKATYIYKELGISKQRFETFRRKLEAAIFSGDTRIKPNLAIVGYYRENYRRNEDGKVERFTWTPYIGHQFSEAMVYEMKKLYPKLIDRTRGRPAK